jgi:hypothetical protein
LFKDWFKQHQQFIINRWDAAGKTKLIFPRHIPFLSPIISDVDGGDQLAQLSSIYTSRNSEMLESQAHLDMNIDMNNMHDLEMTAGMIDNRHHSDMCRAVARTFVDGVLNSVTLSFIYHHMYSTDYEVVENDAIDDAVIDHDDRDGDDDDDDDDDEGVIIERVTAGADMVDDAVVAVQVDDDGDDDIDFEHAVIEKVDALIDDGAAAADDDDGGHDETKDQKANFEEDNHAGGVDDDVDNAGIDHEYVDIDDLASIVDDNGHADNGHTDNGHTTSDTDDQISNLLSNSVDSALFMMHRDNNDHHHHHHDPKITSNADSDDANGDDATTTRRHQVPEWIQLREYALHSWSVASTDDSKTTSPPPPHHPPHHHHHPHQGEGGGGLLFVQDIDATPSFWKSFNHNPFVVEAVTGFEETFPSFYLVPPLSHELYKRCLKCRQVLLREFEVTRELYQLSQECSQRRNHVLTSIQEQMNISTIGGADNDDNNDHDDVGGLANVPSSSSSIHLAINMENSLRESSLLKLRQEGTTEMLTGLTAQYTNRSLLPTASSNSTDDDHDDHDVDQLNKHDKYKPNHLHHSHIRGGRMSGDGDDGYDNHGDISRSESSFFITEKSMQTTQQQQYQHASNEEIFDSEKFRVNFRLFGSYIDTSEYRVFRLDDENNSKVRQKIIEKIKDSLSIVEYSSDTYLPTIRTQQLAQRNREYSRSNHSWLPRNAIRIEKVIRGFLGRRRVYRLKMFLLKNKNAVLIQAIARRYIQRKRFGIMMFDRKFDIFLTRKFALRKYKAWLVIVKFFRKIVQNKVKQRY